MHGLGPNCCPRLFRTNARTVTLALPMPLPLRVHDVLPTVAMFARGPSYELMTGPVDRSSSAQTQDDHASFLPVPVAHTTLLPPDRVCTTWHGCRGKRPDDGCSAHATHMTTRTSDCDGGDGQCEQEHRPGRRRRHECSTLPLYAICDAAHSLWTDFYDFFHLMCCEEPYFTDDNSTTQATLRGTGFYYTAYGLVSSSPAAPARGVSWPCRGCCARTVTHAAATEGARSATIGGYVREGTVV